MKSPLINSIELMGLNHQESLTFANRYTTNADGTLIPIAVTTVVATGAITSPLFQGTGTISAATFWNGASAYGGFDGTNFSIFGNGSEISNLNSLQLVGKVPTANLGTGTGRGLGKRSNVWTDGEPQSKGLKMKAYHGDSAVKEKYLARVRAHRAADELVQGFGYWQDGKGCAVGCTIHGGSHADYETELGIPRMVARLEDGIFEGLGRTDAQAWPEEFLSGIAAGADLSQVADLFLHWLLVDPADGVIRFARTERTKTAITDVGNLYARKIKGETITRQEWKKARSAADAAYATAATAAYATAATAAYAAAAYAAAAAAAAVAAATAAYAAATAAYATAARQKARKRQAEKLLELLRAAPVMESDAI